MTNIARLSIVSSEIRNRFITFISSAYKNFSCWLAILLFCTVPYTAVAQTTGKIDVPDWALPGSATHKQVPPPPDFHRATKTEERPIGIFDGQSDVGGALIPGSSTYNAATGAYTITSAGYNIWYTRDEFRYLWKKMSGDVSLAADIKFPDTTGYGDRKVVLIIRQSLADDSKEAMVALHAAGLIHLAYRLEEGKNLQDKKVPEKSAMRLGIEKKGDTFSLFISMNGEPMKMYGEPIDLHLEALFYVGIGYCSHVPDKADTGIVSNVVLKNAAGELQ